MAIRAGATPDIIYARGVPDDPSPDPSFLDRNDCSLILFEIGLCIDLGCQGKLTKKIEKYHPLLSALRRYRRHVDLVCILVYHADTTLQDTAAAIATTLARFRPSIVKKIK